MHKVLFAASEAAPMAKVGGLGDVIGSLPKALAAVGVEPAIILPRYETIPRDGLKPVIESQPVIYNGEPETVAVYEGSLPDTEIPVFYVENEKYLSKGGPIYFSKSAIAEHDAEFHRFHFFSHAVYALLTDKILPFTPDVVHANDWHTGILVELLKISPQPLPTVFTIHNLANQGVFRDRNSLAEGIRHATAVTTVSETYAKEIQMPVYGAGLDALLRTVRPVGILNGVDYGTLPAPRDRAEAKAALQKELGLTVDPAVPVFGLVSRLVEQKGIHLIGKALERFVSEANAQFVFLGVGEDRYENMLRGYAEKYPKNVSANLFFSEETANAIYQGSDFFLMPSLFEPSGLGQMIAMYYGTVPIVRKTGGLADSVTAETGFVFDDPKPEALEGAVGDAVKAFADAERMAALRDRCRKQDFSWKRSAMEYAKLYDKIRI
ncbi:MAG: glycogen synthase [Patescibacteria group bacterium]|nr:glycogen synthase [Patescibacteria group bacterium]